MQRGAPLSDTDVEEPLRESVEAELCRNMSTWVSVASAMLRCGSALNKTFIAGDHAEECGIAGMRKQLL
jgi:CDGSH-type Zn-finger protein